MTLTQSLSGVYFSSNVPDVKMSINGVRVLVTVTIDSVQVYCEHLYPVGGVVTLSNLSELFTIYARQKLIVDVGITMQDLNSTDGVLSTQSVGCQVAYCAAELVSGNESITPAQFYESHFLTLLQTSKFTGEGRLEYLHFLGSDTATCTAYYSDGTDKTFTVTNTAAGNARYEALDCSPDNFKSGALLPMFYDITAGQRSMRFYVEPQKNPSPALLFVNSFGVEELLYCRGVHKVSPSYQRDSAYIEGKLKNYKIEETRKFEADTGYLSSDMAAWADELLRSDYVRIVTFHGTKPVVGKEITITESKSEVSNLDSELSRFTFSYQYAQRNHNVVDYGKDGRIFDHTFDNTFN